MYNTVIFDLDGTLLNTLDDLAGAGNHVLRALGFAEHSTEEYKYLVGNGVPKLVERMLPENQRGSATQELALHLFMQYYALHSADRTAPYAGIPALLETLHAHGVRLAVVSNKEQSLTQRVIAQYFPGRFDAVSGHVPGTPTKPDPHLVFAVLQQFGAEKPDVLYVGDSNVDIRTAQNAGVASCGVLWGFRTRAELTQAGADHLAADARALQALVLGAAADADAASLTAAADEYAAADEHVAADEHAAADIAAGAEAAAGREAAFPGTAENR